MFVPVMGRAGSAVFALLICGIAASPSAAGPRLSSIRARGHVTCGVDARVAGFAERDAQGRYRGLDVDICRALSAAIFGVPDKVTFVQASSVAEFRRNAAIDVVSRRLTWELRREAPLGLLFGPITFYDGQGFLVAKRVGAATVDRLSGVAMCAAGGTPFEFNVGVYFGAHRLELNKVVLESPDKFDDIAGALAANRCAAYTADVSELGAIRARMQRPGDWDILPDRISQEPLAQLVRADDPEFYDILRWTVFALIEAERLGVTAANVEEMKKRDSVEVQRLLGVVPGNGKALGLPETWAYNVIKALGNYGEMFERNVGRGSPIGLERGQNRLWTNGGLMYAPPLR
jgi:general L-amino acid transport system substrate-binding protein